jgi:hypothetical protein
MPDARPFDPYAIIGALERRRVAYVVIGALARVVHGAEELTDGVDIVPSLRGGNLRRLELALADLEAQRVNGGELALGEQAIRSGSVIEIQSPKGDVKVVPEPAGTRGGYDDLRRAATREPIGKGLRPSVASLADLARMLAALGREKDVAKLRALRRLAELERSLGPELAL